MDSKRNKTFSICGLQKERRIIYVGKIPASYTKKALRRRFEPFGEIEEVSVHFRENG